MASRVGIITVLIMMSGIVVTAQTTVVVPNIWQETEGPGVNQGWLYGDPRYQQVYGADEVGSGRIIEIRLRQDSFWGRPFSDPLTGLTVTLSSTSLEPDALRTNPDDNVGADATIVFNGDLIWTGNTYSGEPWPFEITIPFTTPFDFDDSTGHHLLIDLQFTDWIVDPVYFDAVSEGGDAISRLWCDQSMCEADTLGLITQFVFRGDGIFDDDFEDGTTDAWSTVTAY